MKIPRATIQCLGALVFVASTVEAAALEPVSGFEYLKPESRTLQLDDFENPGLATVERGAELFNTVAVAAAKACADCHGENGVSLDTKAIARYPIYQAERGDGAATIITLQKQIERCRENSGAPVLPPDHPDLIALETFVRNLAIGEIVAVRTDGPVEPLLRQGEALYNKRWGLIDMSCYHCHTLYAGRRVRGQIISQGQANGFPVYRLASGEMASLQQRIQQCLTLMRAEPFAAGSDENVLLELYIMSRGNGLAIETPAVRY
jgi:L-cysteine S-thiosulfotransferase